MMFELQMQKSSLLYHYQSSSALSLAHLIHMAAETGAIHALLLRITSESMGTVEPKGVLHSLNLSVSNTSCGLRLLDPQLLHGEATKNVTIRTVSIHHSSSIIISTLPIQLGI